MHVRFTNPIDGAILNRHDGRETRDGLQIVVHGRCPKGEPVTVNGNPADVKGGEFRATVCLSARETVLRAACAESLDTVTVLYDRNSFKRYRFSLDDDIWFLRDIANGKPHSIFEHPYMALWRRLHQRYGTKVNCNIYYQCDGFNLSMMPDTYRGEWQDNADWFRLTFHALQNDPNEPYIRASYDEIGRDFDLVTNEILRFAGEASLNSFTTVHWGEATRDGCRALRDRGIRGLCGYFVLGQDARPHVSYYLDADHVRHLAGRDYWKDIGEDMIFIRHDIVINGVALDKIAAHMAAVAANPHQRDVMEVMIHEQYFYSDYRAYESDYAERCEATVRWLTENDYCPVFYSHGFLGVPE
ncbi:MAG: hypothetical protein A3K18_30370 [Lentisphaerae bacterium RIFOXYA12_64_32]|nr:MAG: hypothetical protein A3K18_30370 [Lentisphaerae bacterium RIFOXYA12_64_32]